VPEPGFLEGGTDGLADIGPEHFEEAFNSLETVTDIAVMAAPDLMPKLPIDLRTKKSPVNCCDCTAKGVPSFPTPETSEFPPAFSDDQVKDLQLSLAARAQSLRYRFAILDSGGERATPEQAIRWSKSLPGSCFSALYYPWILVDDPLRLTGLVRVVPPSGHIAGIFARSDHRKGVHKPPMNEVIEAVSDVPFRIDETDHGELNDNNVNAVRIMPGRGVRVMGARTLFRENILLRYVNVRRLLSAIERALEQSLNWAVFEPNNPQLWLEIDRIVRSFLETLFRRGMLDGESSERAYSVRCDDQTNPSDETDLGRVICEVGVQPPYPAEFVVALGISKDGIQIREGSEQSA
jgi:phage tail sheath protein FI